MNFEVRPAIDAVAQAARSQLAPARASPHLQRFAAVHQRPPPGVIHRHQRPAEPLDRLGASFAQAQSVRLDAPQRVERDAAQRHHQRGVDGFDLAAQEVAAAL